MVGASHEDPTVGKAVRQAASRAVSRRAVLRGVGVSCVAAGLAGCGLDGTVLASGPTIRVAVSWSAAELAAFRRLVDQLDRIPGQSPKPYSVALVPFGDDISAALSARGAGRVDVVMLPRPGFVPENLDVLEPLPPGVWPDPLTKDTYAAVWRPMLLRAAKPQECGLAPTVRADPGVPYGLPFKLAHKSLVWYRRCLFDAIGAEPPTTWDAWIELNARLVGSGVAPLALAGADGWPLTDFFENVLLGGAPCAYDALAQPAPRPWGTPEVREAFLRLGAMWSPAGALSGGVRRSLVQQYPDAVLEVFRYHRAAMTVAPDFAEPIVRRFGADDSGCADDVGIFAFPGPDESHRPVMAGGDVAVLTRPARPEAKDFLKRLAHPSAPLAWIEADHGFIAANRDTPQRYSPEIAAFARQLHDEPFHFDLSDQLDVLGGREGLWRVLQDFLSRVGDGATDEVEVATDAAVHRLTAMEDVLLRDAEDAGCTTTPRSRPARIPCPPEES